MTTPSFAAFPTSEHRERIARAREELSAAGLDGCIVVAPENLFYLAGYDSIASYIAPQALVFSVRSNDDPTLLIRDIDLPLAQETTWVTDIRVYHLNDDDIGRALAKIVHEHGGSGKWGIEFQSYAVTGAYLDLIRASLPGVKFEDAGSALNRIQYTKSAAELRYIREAAGYANIGVDAARSALRAGIKETALCGAVEGAMRLAGSDYPAIPTECSSGSRSSGGHATAMPKIIGPNEIVHLEFAGVSRRYHSVSMITMATGEPGKRARWLYDVALESLNEGLAACRPGAHVADIDNASLAPIRRAGLVHAALMRFGIGIGIGYPPIWVGTFQIDRFSDGVLRPGMVFYVHSWLSLLDEGLGVMIGGTYLVSDSGIELLSGAGAVDLFVA